MSFDKSCSVLMLLYETVLRLTDKWLIAAFSPISAFAFIDSVEIALAETGATNVVLELNLA